MNDDAIRISFKIFNCLYKLQHAVSFIIIKYADFVKMSFFNVCNFWFNPLCDYYKIRLFDSKCLCNRD